MPQQLFIQLEVTYQKSPPVLVGDCSAEVLIVIDQLGLGGPHHGEDDLLGLHVHGESPQASITNRQFLLASHLTNSKNPHHNIAMRGGEETSPPSKLFKLGALE